MCLVGAPCLAIFETGARMVVMDDELVERGGWLGNAVHCMRARRYKREEADNEERACVVYP